jgi:glycosyltransferase involved in cell wall biosynthesis
VIRGRGPAHTRLGNGPRNLAVLRPTALNVVQTDAGKVPLRSKSIRADRAKAASSSNQPRGSEMRLPSSEDVSIAVIIPLYNGELYIRAAIESVFRQSLPPTEVIVVNDGSTDNGPMFVEQLALEHPITLLHKPNGGQSSARNMGIAHASSSLIALLDQDDIWYSDHLVQLVKPFRRQRTIELGWVYSDLDEIDRQGRLIARSILRFVGNQNPKRDLHSCLRTDMFILPSASLMSRKAFEAVGGFDERLHGYEDDDLFLRMFRYGYDNVFLDRSLSQWRIFTGSASFTPRMAVSRMVYLKKLLLEFPDEPDRGLYWSRDFLLPRFFPMLLRQFRYAVRARDQELISKSLADLEFASRYHTRKVRRAMVLLTPLLRIPGLAKALLAVRPALRPIVRRILT